MPPSMNAALGALSPERSGVGSALIQAARQVGSAIGVAVLGSVLNGGYRDQVDVSGLPGAAADAVRDSAAGGVAVAARLGDPGLLDSVRAAFTHGDGPVAAGRRRDRGARRRTRAALPASGPVRAAARRRRSQPLAESVV